METSKIAKLIRWFREGTMIAKIVGISLCLIVIIFTVRLIIKSSTTVEVSARSEHMMGKTVEEEVTYSVNGGVALSANLATETWTAMAQINKISGVANNLKSIAEEALAQNKAKGTKELVIPANAWCEEEDEYLGYAAYEWEENSYHFFSTTPRIEKHKVLIIKPMGFHIIHKKYGFDVLVYEILEKI